MHIYYLLNIGKNISILAKVTQVSDVAHGPLVFPDVFSRRLSNIMLIAMMTVLTLKKLCCKHYVYDVTHCITDLIIERLSGL
jgi:hypothetical protein